MLSELGGAKTDVLRRAPWYRAERVVVPAPFEASPRVIPAELNDETLRDGLQSPSVRHPPVEAKLEALELMERLGVSAVSLGLPAAGPRAKADVEAGFRALIERRSGLHAHCAARTKVEDLIPIADINQRVGAPLTAYAFIGSSPIRRFAEGWTLDELFSTVETALRFAERERIPVAFVTEDTTRSRPGELEWLFRHAISLGVRRLVLCDTVGYATPEGAERLVRFARRVASDTGEHVELDWHGHDDRGLAVAAARAAERAGADRIHGTMLGVGERCGNADLERLLENHAADYGRPIDQDALERYRALVRSAWGFE